jgi:hypothetical protein
MKRRSLSISIRISRELQSHIVETGDLSVSARALMILGLASVGRSLARLYPDLALLTCEEGIYDPVVQSAVSRLAEEWRERGLAVQMAASLTDDLPHSYTRAEWEALCAKYDRRCLACGAPAPLTPDHVLPIAKGGSDDIRNIQPLCFPCNKRKGDEYIDYRLAEGTEGDER